MNDQHSRIPKVVVIPVSAVNESSNKPLTESSMRLDDVWNNNNSSKNATGSNRVDSSKRWDSSGSLLVRSKSMDSSLSDSQRRLLRQRQNRPPSKPRRVPAGDSIPQLYYYGGAGGSAGGGDDAER